jgi:hypothetical protein
MINILGVGYQTSSILKSAKAVTAKFTKMRDDAQKVNDQIDVEATILSDKIDEIHALQNQLADARKANTGIIKQVDQIIGG